MHVYHKTSVST